MSDGKFVGRQPCSQGEKNSKFVRKCWRKTLGRTLKAVQGQQKQDCLPIWKKISSSAVHSSLAHLVNSWKMSVNRSIHVQIVLFPVSWDCWCQETVEGLSDWSQMRAKKVDLRVSQVEHHKILISFFSYIRRRYITVWIWPKSRLGHNICILYWKIRMIRTECKINTYVNTRQCKL